MMNTLEGEGQEEEEEKKTIVCRPRQNVKLPDAMLNGGDNGEREQYIHI